MELERSYSRAHALAVYLRALATLNDTTDTYVRREITVALAEVQRELGLTK